MFLGRIFHFQKIFILTIKQHLRHLQILILLAKVLLESHQQLKQKQPLLKRLKKVMLLLMFIMTAQK